ncbi:hypothetical protein HDU92_000523 [Lobulomyces angularis]|nr:hypothetical protein HDU92_000523 [Lobulomyces angularis]
MEEQTIYKNTVVSFMSSAQLKIIDCIYGEFLITEPILIRLITSKTCIRLKGVYQHGISGFLSFTPPVTRFDHSLGAMLLVRLLHGSLEEQIAALLHDISHTAFSHVSDHLFPSEISYHERMKETYVFSTSLPEILEEFNFDTHRIIEETNFGLLERPSPHLCADRTDYGLRDCYAFGYLSIDDIRYIINNLAVKDNYIVCLKEDVAILFGKYYAKADENVWSNPFFQGLYEVTSTVIKEALKLNIVEEKDLFLEDQQFWEKIKTCSDQKLKSLIDLVENFKNVSVDSENFDFKVPFKVRTIDPDVLVEDKMVSLSQINNDYRLMMEVYRKEKLVNGNQFFLRVDGFKSLYDEIILR